MKTPIENMNKVKTNTYDKFVKKYPDIEKKQRIYLSNGRIIWDVVK